MKHFVKTVRTLFQISFLIAVLFVGYRYSQNQTLISIETFCPFGGLEAAASLLTSKQFVCATGERNLALFLALVAMTLFLKKCFCSWICPVGAISEWIRLLHIRLIKIFPYQFKWMKAIQPSILLEKKLRWMRLPILSIILFFTYYTGELIFRSYDPYYILFSFHGHEVAYWSYFFASALLIAMFLIPFAWCRFLCPLSIALSPFSRLSRVRVVRQEDRCTHCNMCDRSCSQQIMISETTKVYSSECTLCLECTHSCPIPGTLDLRLE